MINPQGQDWLRAITLWRPWPSAMAHLGKPLENRTWASWLKPGEWVAIHAGKKFDQAGAEWVARGFEIEDAAAFLSPANHPTGVILLARFKQNVEAAESPWFTGPVAWEFDRRIVLDKPVDCAGKQGIWMLSPEQRASVLAQCSFDRVEAFSPSTTKAAAKISA